MKKNVKNLIYKVQLESQDFQIHAKTDFLERYIILKCYFHIFN